MSKSRKGQPAAVAEETAVRNGEEWAPRGHLIRIPDTEARRRAIVLLGDVPHSYCVLPDFQFALLNAHLEVLKRAAIPFETL